MACTSTAAAGTSAGHGAHSVDVGQGIGQPCRVGRILAGGRPPPAVLQVQDARGPAGDAHVQRPAAQGHRLPAQSVVESDGRRGQGHGGLDHAGREKGTPRFGFDPAAGCGQQGQHLALAGCLVDGNARLGQQVQRPVVDGLDLCLGQGAQPAALEPRSLQSGHRLSPIPP
jgi:hypothetical protein